jgi:sterol desaturase/sphingolipid hydroxylase (fatty acid hydroxylase superfamily)
VSDWLLAQSGEILSLSLQLGLLCAVVLESMLPRRRLFTPRVPRWWQQLAMMIIGSLLARLCLPLAAVSLAALVHQNHWGLFNRVAVPLPASLLIGVVVLDCSEYALHRLSHAVPLLWRFHQVHHADLDVDCGTAVRHHPGEALIGQAFVLAVIAILGIAPIAVFLSLAIGIIVDIFNHSNLALPERVDRSLRRLIVTPDMHRIHHSADFVESNRNFGSILPWWDHLFSTYLHAPEGGQMQMNLGLAHLRSSEELSLTSLLLLPFRPLVSAQGGQAARHEIAG